MSPYVSEQLSPQPFRQWCAWRLDPKGWDRSDSAPVGDDTVRQLAFDLGIGERRLHRWRKENASLERIDVEEALHHADVQFWEVYPQGVPPIPTPLPQHQPGYGSKLNDEEVLRLHDLHRKGVAVCELARRIWRSAGYRSDAAARKGIQKGFRRLGLETVPVPAYRRCEAIKAGGGRCEKQAMVGSDHCMQHDPERRREVVEQLVAAGEVLDKSRAAA